MGASPQQNEVSVNPTTEAITDSSRPMRVASHPVIGCTLHFSPSPGRTSAPGGFVNRSRQASGDMRQQTLTMVVSSTLQEGAEHHRGYNHQGCEFFRVWCAGLIGGYRSTEAVRLLPAMP